MKKNIFIILMLISVCFASVLPQVCSANDTGLKKTAEKAGLETGNLASIIGNLLKIVYSFLGVVLLILIIYAGILWMTAGGDETQVKKAKDWILNALIGLAIILMAYVFTDYIMRRIMEAV